MDDDDRVLARLGRIDVLSRSGGTGRGARSGELLAELRSLLREAEVLARERTAADDGERGGGGGGRRRKARAGDIIGV